jgi:hypothetical protein
MRNIARKVLFPVVLSIVCTGAAITLFHSATSQPVIASSVQTVSQQTTESPSLTWLGVLGLNRSYRFTINRPEDLVYLQCPANYAPKFGCVRNVEVIRCERFRLHNSSPA